MDPAAKQAFATGMAKARSGDPVAAVAEFTRALEIHPDWLLARLNRAASWFLAKHLPAALTHFHAAARIQLGEFEGALADCDEVLRAKPKHRDAAVNRATARILTRNFTGAAADAETVLEAEPGAVEGLYIRGVARTGLEQFPAAL